MNTHGSCPFCRENNLLDGQVTAETDGGYVVVAHKHPGHYLIIPAAHTETLADLPDDWWRTFKLLLAKIPGLRQYNMSINLGKNAGQHVGHLHFWIVPREDGRPSTGKGLAALIQSVDA